MTLPKLAQSSIDKIEAEINRRVRVQRPNILAFLLGGGFAKLPAVKEVDLAFDYTRYKLRSEGKLKGWTVPVSDLGRKQIPTYSAAESLRAWIDQNLGDRIPRDKVGIVFEKETNEVVIYRKV